MPPDAASSDAARCLQMMPGAPRCCQMIPDDTDDPRCCQMLPAQMPPDARCWLMLPIPTPMPIPTPTQMPIQMPTPTTTPTPIPIQISTYNQKQYPYRFRVPPKGNFESSGCPSNFVSVWNLGIFGKSFFFYLWDFQESTKPLKIPTPTPAPDRGGPVACLGGPAGPFLPTIKKTEGYKLHTYTLFKISLLDQFCTSQR